MTQTDVQASPLDVQRPLRVGFVGAGWVVGQHIRAIKQIGNVEVVAVAGRSLNKVQTLIQSVGVSATPFDDYHRMYDEANLDAVYICTIPGAHGEVEYAALDHNLGLFIEKPLSADPTTAEEIGKAIAAKGAISSVGYQWRYLNTLEAAQELVKTHPPQMALGYWLDGLPPPRWWSIEAESGGQVVEQTTHMIDLARLLVGEVKQVYALGRKTNSPGSEIDVDRASVVTLEFENGVIGTISSTSLLKSGYRVGLELISDGAVINFTNQRLVVDEGKGNTHTVEITVDPFLRINYDFLRAVAGAENTIRSTYADSLKTHRVTQAAARSARENRVVAVEG